MLWLTWFCIPGCVALREWSYHRGYLGHEDLFQMWNLDYKAGWALTNLCFQIVVLEKTLETPLECKEIKPVNPKGNHHLNIHWKYWCWSFRSVTTCCEGATHWKKPCCWGMWKAKEKMVAENEIVEQYHWLSAHEFQQTLEIIKGRGSWSVSVHGATNCQTRCSTWTTTKMLSLFNYLVFFVDSQLIVYMKIY